MSRRATPQIDLIVGAQAGSEEACDELVGAYWQRSWKTALAITSSTGLADEICQDAFERAFSRIHRFGGERQFGAWIEQITVNRAIDVLRAEQRRAERETKAAERPVFEMDEPVDQALLAAVRRLAPDARVVVALRYWLDYSPAMIADALSIAEGTAKSRLSRAIDHLRQDLGDDHER